MLQLQWSKKGLSLFTAYKEEGPSPLNRVSQVS